MAEEQKIDIKEALKREFVKCAKDPEYFLKKYVWIQTTDKGRELFSLFLYQQKVLHLITKHKRLDILKSRQLGLTTLIAGYCIWAMTFKPDYKILAIAPTQEKAIHILAKVRFAYDNLPEWLKEKEVKNNEKTLSLGNGSEMRALTGAGDSARGFTGHFLIIDEAAFIDNAEELWGSSQQTLATGGKAIILSTPNGHGNWFHKLWQAAEMSENDFLPIKLPWNLHPGRDQAWRKKQDVELGEKMAAQECDCDFMTSGEGYFDEKDKKFIEDNIEEPLEKRGQRQTYWIWKYPQTGRSYVILADVARGDGADANGFHVMDLDTWEQVAEVKDAEIGTTEYAKLLVQVGIDYNNAFLIIDRVGLGWAVVQGVIDMGYSNMYYSPKSEITDLNTYLDKYYDLGKEDMVPGFGTSTKNRAAVVNAGGLYVRTRTVKMRSRRFWEEMKTFIWKNGKPQAMRGYNDDLIMPFAFGCYLRDTVFEYRTKGLEMTRATLGGIKRVTSQTLPKQNQDYIKQDIYKMKIPGQPDQDLTWLLG